MVLVALAPFYGYERDELYFRMLPPAWGYVDQPPLTPLLVHAVSTLVDSVWAIRLPAALLASASVVLIALLAREVGGSPLAQAYAAWGSAFGTFTLVFGHSFLTGTIDLVVWPAVLLGAIRAVLRNEGRWWLLAGGAAGIGLSNKLLITFLLVGIAVGLAAVGPWRQFRSPWLWLGGLAVLLLGAPALVYQVATGLPQLRVGAALSADNGGSVRILTIPYLALLLSPIVVPIWVAGLVALFRRPAWRPIRFVAIAFLVVVLLAAMAGGQVYYSYGALTGIYAIGCVPTADWARGRGRRLLIGIALGVSCLVTSLIALPVVPLGLLAHTPIPAINQATADQVGWPQLAAAVDRAGAGTGSRTIVLTSNYGEAGAVTRYSRRFAGAVWSGHNALQQSPPPRFQPATVLVVGGQIDSLRQFFASCRTAARIDDAAGVDNEEQGEPISRCVQPRRPIQAILRAAAHLD